MRAPGSMSQGGGPEREGRVRTFMASPVPFFLGEISFGIFEIHMFVLVQGMRDTKLALRSAGIAAHVPACVAMSSVMRWRFWALIFTKEAVVE